MKEKKFEASAVLSGCEIEFTNYCSLDCNGCVRKESKEFGFLSKQHLIKIIKIVKINNYKEITLSGLGDVFLHPDFYDFIDYIFLELPDIGICIMTKGQSITQLDIDKIALYKEKGFKLNITYSLFSLNADKYKIETGGGSLNNTLELIKYSYKSMIDFNFEFFLSIDNIHHIKKYIRFCNLFSKEFRYSIPHNWGGKLIAKDYNKLFNDKLLGPIIETRKKGEICEAFGGNYMFFDFSGKIFKCSLKRLDNSLYIGDIKNFNGEMKIFDYNKCKDCSYYKYKTYLSE